jgi:ATP-dependent helicase HrpA
MPFDLVIDEHTADGQEARVSKTSVAGSWGAVAGSLRYFADRFGIPRASIEGTTLSYDLVRKYATSSPPRIVLGGPRKHQRLVIERRRTYFGFELETELETLEDEVPLELQPAAREVLAQAVWEGETTHPDQNRLRRVLGELDELWRRSGGTLQAISPVALRGRIRDQLDTVGGWQDFLRTRILLDREQLIDSSARSRLEELPARVHIRGDAVPLDYEVQNGEGVVRVRLREGQAKRIRSEELPRFDRPLRFSVQRGNHSPLLADSLSELQAQLRRPLRVPDDDEYAHPHRGGRRREQRGGHRAHRRGRRNSRRR